MSTTALHQRRFSFIDNHLNCRTRHFRSSSEYPIYEPKTVTGFLQILKDAGDKLVVVRIDSKNGSHNTENYCDLVHHLFPKYENKVLLIKVNATATNHDLVNYILRNTGASFTPSFPFTAYYKNNSFIDSRTSLQPPILTIEEMIAFAL